jgi:NADPH-dependent glutamate synthase beta subunit-like oxidoreductase/NAD-dependent dihydropyrimidine dehydrogenase PreA subunit
VVGSGPSGLAAASDLARLGYPVTVLEKEYSLGGLLRFGIGPHRLPRKILDYEIDYIRRLGVEFKTSSPIQLPQDLKHLGEQFDAVVLATGAWLDRKLGVSGEDLEGVEGCLSFLSEIYRNGLKEFDETVAVIGDGNAAFDLARTLGRMGARVEVLSWFPEGLIPADFEEIDAAKDEGISLRDRVQVVGFVGENGRMNRLVCRPTKPGQPDDQGIPWPVLIPEEESFELEFDRAVIAIGQTGPQKNPVSLSGFEISSSGFLNVNGSWATNIDKVYAIGDAVTGASSVVEAMATGRAVAKALHLDLNREEALPAGPQRPEESEFPEIPRDAPSLARVAMPQRRPLARKGSFEEVALGLSESQVHAEAERCLQCGICSECLLCQEACDAIGAVDHSESGAETIEHAGVVIMADPDLAPRIKGADVIRAYGPKAAKTDVQAMMTRGFAAAANAMILLGGGSQRLKGHGLSFSPPDPELSTDIRLGVFVCRCNDSLGWTEGMTDFVDKLSQRADIAHTELLTSACTPEGAAEALRAIRQRGITRAVLASCVCCPLDFVCSACTDQRSRLKDALFKGTGVSRSMVETCNLRGEVLRYLKIDPNHALRRFEGLLDRSISRAKRLKPLPTPVRNYNFTTAVVGQSEAAVSSAFTLAEAGLEVFMFGTKQEPLSEHLSHPQIHSFEGSRVKAISGTLGDFQVYIQTGDFHQTLQVGAVILGENSRRRMPYLQQEGLQSRTIESATQKKDLTGIPFLYPGSTAIAGLFLANPPGLPVSLRKKGAAAAILAAALMPRGPRQSRGFTVVVDEGRCRGCGRCVETCPYQAIAFRRSPSGGWCAAVDEALCKGCGNCISICPTNAADSPYRDQGYLEQILEEVLIRVHP